MCIKASWLLSEALDRNYENIQKKKHISRTQKKIPRKTRFSVLSVKFFSFLYMHPFTINVRNLCIVRLINTLQAQRDQFVIVYVSYNNMCKTMWFLKRVGCVKHSYVLSTKRFTIRKFASTFPKDREWGA